MATETATIEVQRALGGLSDHLRSYEVVIDGEVVGGLRANESGVFEVAPGSHEVYLKIDWGRSEKINVHLAAGETARFYCEPRSNSLTAFYWITFGRHRYITLTQVSD